MEISEIIDEFLKNEKYNEMDKYIAHGRTSVLTHMMNVAYLCFRYAEAHPKKKYDIKSLVRGAMMHDFYLYDWHEKNHKRPHGFFHPYASYLNSSKYFDVNKIERNMIMCHMWPLTFWRIPRYKESWLLQKMDKKATRYEMKNKEKSCSLFEGK